MFIPILFWPWFSGLVFLIAGLVLVRGEFGAAAGLDKLIVPGRVFVASALAVFAAEHMVSAEFIKNMVPAWIPAHLFWAYFAGTALLAAAVSFTLARQVRLSGAFLGIMFFLFVVLIHLPNVVANPKDRFAWAVALRDFAFGAGAWAYAGSEDPGDRWSKPMISVGRFGIASVLLFYALEHFLHPAFAPGVPLEMLTPRWIPAPPVWGYATGAILLMSAIAILGKRAPSAGAAWAGTVVVALTIVIYAPLLVAAAQPRQINEAVNYIADTLLFGGTLLLLALALRRQRAAL